MSNFHFDISLSILNHLGRNLYRNFITVIGETISNSWDADANNVYIYIENNSLIVLDDGKGMTAGDFQDKFLNIGYSKRVEFGNISEGKRPFIGRKGIGKLALLSCAKRIHILSKKEGYDVTGGVIDNTILDEKIKDNNTTQEYPLEPIDNEGFLKHPRASGFNQGTLIYFEELNDGIRNNLEAIRKLIVLHFRFSLIDPNFNIFVNDKPISFDDIKDLSENTQFLWQLGGFNDEFYSELINLKESENLEIEGGKIYGFITSVQLPKFLNIFGTGEKTGIDLFVNGRLRETNILRNMPGFSTRHIASYLYGQIHINDLDDDEDRFTSSREGIKPGDEKYGKYLEEIEKVLSHVSKRWDEWRRKHKETWDIENGEMPKFQALMEQSKHKREKDFEDKLDSLNIEPEIKESLKERLKQQSSNNTSVYQDLFILENLFREYIRLKGIGLLFLADNFGEDKEIMQLIDRVSRTKISREEDEETHALKGKIVKTDDELNYVDFVYLAMLVDIANNATSSGRFKPLTFEAHSKEMLAVRNPIMHTNEITDDAYAWDKIRNIIDYIDKLANKESQ